MKKLIASVTIASFVATSAFAGSMIAPEMEPMVEVVEEEPLSGDGGGEHRAVRSGFGQGGPPHRALAR